MKNIHNSYLAQNVQVVKYILRICEIVLIKLKDNIYWSARQILSVSFPPCLLSVIPETKNNPTNYPSAYSPLISVSFVIETKTISSVLSCTRSDPPWGVVNIIL